MIVTRLVYAAGKTYAPAANAADGNAASQADIYLTGDLQADYLLFDLGASASVGTVTLSNVSATINPLAVWVSDNPTPDSTGNVVGGAQFAAPTANPQAAGSTYVFTSPQAGGTTGRYIFVRQTFTVGANSSALIGEAAYAPPGAPPPTSPTVAAPTLSATPALPNNVSTIQLAGA